MLRNTLSRNTFQLVAVVLGGPRAVALVVVAVAGMLLASTAPPEATQAVVWSWAGPPW